MRPGARRILTALCVAGALAVPGLLLYWGEPRPGSAPVLPGIIALFFGVVAAGFAVLARPDGGGVEGGWRWTPALLVLSLSVVGFSLRIAFLGNFGLSNDESFFAFAASQESLAESIRESLTHFHPPPNFIVLHYLLKVSWDPTWVRLASIVGGTLAIAATYLFVRALFGTLAGLIAAFLVTFSPNLILLSQVCRNYSPSMPFFVMSLYFLARYLRERREAFLYGFALFELISVMWLYGYLPAFLGANLVLFYTVLRGEEAIRNAARAIAAQIPVGALYIWAVVFHLPITQGGQRGRVVGFMVEEFHFDPTNPLRQLLALFKYLVADYPDVVSMIPTFAFLIGALLGAVRLVRLGMGRQVALCLAFLPFAYVFAFVVQLLPFGGTRHSFYAFPFLFALIAGCVSLLVLGKDRLAAEAGAGGETPEGGGEEGSARGGARRAVAIALAVLSTGFVWTSLRQHLDTTSYLLRRSPHFREVMAHYKADFYKVPELPTRIQDLDLIAQGVLVRTRPGEIIVVSFSTYLILRAHLAPPPPSVAFEPYRAHEFQWEGRRFIHPGNTGLGLTTNELIVAVELVAQNQGLADHERVWVAQAGWEAWGNSLRDFSRTWLPGVVIEAEDGMEGDDTLFALRVGQTRQYARIEFGTSRDHAPPRWMW